MECAPWGAKELPTTWYVGLTARCSVFFLLNQSIDNHIYIYISYLYIYYIYIHVHRWFTLIHTNRTSMQYTISHCYRIKYYVIFFVLQNADVPYMYGLEGPWIPYLIQNPWLRCFPPTSIYLFVYLSMYLYLLLFTLSISICIYL
jgi:hypothetical protein